MRCSVRSLACFLLSGSRRSIRSSISGVRGVKSLPLLPLELEAADADPPRRIPELSASLPWSLDLVPCCLRGANMFCCSTELLSGFVPTLSLMDFSLVQGCQTLGGWHPWAVPPPVVVALDDGVPVVVAPVGCTPLPLGGKYTVGAWCSPRHISAMLMSSSMYSSQV